MELSAAVAEYLKVQKEMHPMSTEALRAIRGASAQDLAAALPYYTVEAAQILKRRVRYHLQSR